LFNRGAAAAKKAQNVDRDKHVVITTSHPSPLGATKTSSPFLVSCEAIYCSSVISNPDIINFKLFFTKINSIIIEYREVSVLPSAMRHFYLWARNQLIGIFAKKYFILRQYFSLRWTWNYINSKDWLV